MYISFFVSFSLNLLVSGQNLVPNGGFEKIIECPSFPGNVTAQCANWYASILPAEMATPEWFHECSKFEVFSPPDVAFGFQEPYEGQGYCGFASYAVNFPIMLREIIAVNLTAPLEIGSTYLVDFKFTPLYNLAETAALIDKIGFNFSTHPYYNFDAFPINMSHYSNDTIITLTDEWLGISQFLEADSAYAYLHIGNFYDDDMTAAIFPTENSSSSYFAVDDVSVTKLVLSDGLLGKKYDIKVYPNPCANQLTIQNSSQHGIQRIEIFDTVGRRVFEKEYQSLSQEVILNEVGSFLKGTYIIKITTGESTVYESVLKL